MYKNTRRNHGFVILWGFSSSAWTGKMRSYLLKTGIPFEEHFQSEERFQEEIVPLIGYSAAPAIELRDGTLLQDSTEAMLYLKGEGGRADLLPKDSLQRTLAWLLNFFGSDGFHKPGMHYRWNFPENNGAWLRAAFLQSISKSNPTDTRRRLVDEAMARPHGIVPKLGVYAETIPVIEESWLKCIGILENHFSLYPYLLGGLPSVADCGLMTMFGAHLARDPYSSSIMKTRAPNLFRWSERMNTPGVFDGDFYDTAQTYFEGDEIPSSLTAFLCYLFSDYGPELQTTIHLFNEWVQSKGLQANSAIKETKGFNSPHPIFGQFEYKLRETTIKRVAFIDTVYQYQYVARLIDSLREDDQSRFRAQLKGVGGEWLMDLRAAQILAYRGYHYEIGLD
jgi:glutathione S-transferase